ncbi:pentapeptide repeat-containing protein [Nocardia cyriacigeorgica]|nr:pentapeptide repeat-containing protein [Nocardia cyriacigeorgica]MBF6494753.1 pentapeptide repeat-containing protein [Nocardia cyriacigeorgica]
MLCAYLRSSTRASEDAGPRRAITAVLAQRSRQWQPPHLYYDLSGAILSGANLSRADLRGANLSLAKLREANLSDAVHDAVAERFRTAGSNRNEEYLIPLSGFRHFICWQGPSSAVGEGLLAAQRRELGDH